MSQTWGVGDGGKYTINMSDECKYEKGEKEKIILKQMEFIYQLLKKAKVENIEELKGIPVEVTLDGNAFYDFRILTEVL